MKKMKKSEKHTLLIAKGRENTVKLHKNLINAKNVITRSLSSKAVLKANVPLIFMNLEASKAHKRKEEGILTNTAESITTLDPKSTSLNDTKTQPA